MIYDCFTFYNELDLLEIRLNELNNYVDFFVLVESPFTFTGNSKPLYYQENKKRFRKFNKKIIHIVASDILEPPIITNKPQYINDPNIQKNSSYWNREFYQRNCILDGLSRSKENDTILISDIDEIPNSKVFSKNYKLKNKIYGLDQLVSYYYLNCISNEKWVGTKIVLKKNLNTPQEIRENKNYKLIKHGGWHFSYLGKPQTIQNKIKSFSHQEYNFQEFNSLKNIRFNIDNNLDLFHRSTKYSITPINNSFPKYIFLNQSKLKKYIKQIVETDPNTRMLQKSLLGSRDYINKLDMRISKLIPVEQELIKIKNSKFYRIWQLYLTIKKSITGVS